MRHSEYAKERAVDFFYPIYIEDGKKYRWWRGFKSLFEPDLPSRLFDEFLGSVRGGLEGDIDCLDDAITFLSSSHLKKLSAMGRGQADVMCHPTEKAKEGVRLLSEYKKALERKYLHILFRG